MLHIRKILLWFLNRHAKLIKSDRLFLQIKYFLKVGHFLHLKHPKGFCEKLQWLKLYDRKDIYTVMVDKFAVKEYVSNKIGDKYVIENYGVWDRTDDIDFDALPNQFVLKTTHAAGMSGVVVCKDKASFDFSNAKNKLSRSLGLESFWKTREWPYKDIQPRIIAERYLEDESGALNDYKVMCFNGEAKLIQLHMGRARGIHTQDFYDVNWNKLNDLDQLDCVQSDIVYPKPKCLEEMLALSNVLSKGLPQLRVDWYVVDGQLFFGELTFYDASGYDLFIPYEKEIEIGRWITLPR